MYPVKKQITDRRRSVYEVSDDGFKRLMSLNLIKYRKGELPGVTLKNDTVTVDKTIYKDPLEKIFHKHGPYISPDEVVSTSRGTIVEVPIKQREEFTDVKLPDSELLKVLHYYASHRLEEQGWRLTAKYDETALLQLGMLVENWIDDAVTTSAARMFAERDARRVPQDESQDESQEMIIDDNDSDEDNGNEENEETSQND